MFTLDSESSVGPPTPDTVDGTGTVASNFANIIRFHPPSNNIGDDSIDRHELLNSIDINSGLPLYQRNDIWRSWSAPPSSRPSRRAPSPPVQYQEPEGLCNQCHRLYLDNYFLARHLRTHCRGVKIQSAMHRHNHTPAFLLATEEFPNPAFLPSSTRLLQQWERGPDGVASESPAMNDRRMSDDPNRNGYSCLPAITIPTDSSSGWDTDMDADDGNDQSRDVENATQEMERMSIDNFEDDAEMDMTDFDGDTEM